MDQEQQSRWRPTGRQLLWAGGIAAVAFLVIAIYGYLFEWKWTGLPKRTLWDWLDLLIVPTVLALGGYLFTRSESQRTRADADQQRSLDREIADARRQDDMLQAYLDGMSQLLTDEKRPLHRAQVDDSLSTVARARTLTVLTRLDSNRKGSVLQFLYESRVIAADHLVLRLNGANLRTVSLFPAFLRGAYLNAADLSMASLPAADLSGAYLRAAFLGRADLRGADLRSAYLINAKLMKANLLGANLFEADLSNAYLQDADLSGANLNGASVTDEQLADTWSLQGATMPNGQKYEDWLTDRESRKEDSENE